MSALRTEGTRSPRNLLVSAESGPQLIAIGDLHLETRWIGPPPSEAPTIVFLHEGLGSVSRWRDFPDRIAGATGCGTLVYSRRGYGSSDPYPGPRPARFMHDEALEVLPRVLERFGIAEPILFGHSDGASIALIYAGSGLGPVRGLVLEAPHVFVEPVCVQRIADIAAEPLASDLLRRLVRHHGANTEALFRSWTGVWLSPEFLHWNIEEFLPVVTAPCLVIQGRDDEYGTLRQVEAIAAQAGGPVETLVLDRCGHSPHVDRAEEVLAAATRFVVAQTSHPPVRL
jgi:pimeloyl-ACP methyl ester carboxylesterase